MSDDGPGPMMRRGFTVALVGPDGAGKTTIARAMEQELGLPARYIYLGDNLEALGPVLPTTRLVRALKRRRGTVAPGGPPGRSAGARRSGGPLAMLRGAARLTNQLAEEWYRQLVAWNHVRRGRVVVFDRHFFFDYRAHDVAAGREAPVSKRIHGLVLSRLYPRPDLVIGLDAPADVLFERKREGTVEALRARRGEYLDAGDAAETFVAVDANRPLADVKRDVFRLVCDYARSRWSGSARPTSAP